ncbi:unnamed protein product [Rotaria sordida]|uniref:RRM domain-containing protein n=1 Tax=Rotaria sordida TaxID=392033 RepID=A0A814BVB1_9BILA|nr:unnamed protein product [Rotaria sordida]CAF1031416.1 unnamed protein product [Rotaria sordida]CAF3565866.1 unnamed protein product [Rotaria sordida]
MSSYHRNISSHYLEICIGGVGYQTEPHTLLTYFEQFGTIDHYSFTSPNGGGIVFITYTNPKSVDRCMTSRPHRIDGQHLYVKRAIPYNAEYPREHIDSSRDIMIVIDSINVDELSLKDLREYFSSYGTLYACKYCHEANFDYILVEFADYDQVDRIILDKPHYFNKHELNIMKYIAANKILMSLKYSTKENSSIKENSIDIDDEYKFLKFELNLKKNDLINEHDLENEAYQLQNHLKQIIEDFNIKRKQLEDDCCEQLRKLNENADKTHQLQQDLEQEYAKLLVEYESLKHENEVLNEQYITAELENFEITSYYEQILLEEKAKTAQYEAEYTEKLRLLYTNDSIPQSSSRPTSITRTSTSLSPPAVPDGDDDDE